MTGFLTPFSSRQRHALVWGYSIYAVASLVSMAAMSIGAAILFASLLFAFGGPRGLRDAIRSELGGSSDVRRYAYVMIALFVACAISLLGALVFPLEYGGKGPDVHFVPDLAKAWYLFWPLLLLPGLRALGHEGRKPVLRAWILAFGVLSAIGVIQYYTGWPRPRPIPENDGHFHATLFLGHHLSVASIFIFPFFAALAFFRQTGASSNSIGLPRWVLGLAAALGAMALFDTYSRALWVALPIGLLAWLLWSLPRRFSAGICVALVLGLVATLQVPSVKNRVFATRGITTREKLWGANWEFFKHRPLTGTGWHHNIEVSGYYLMDLEKTNEVFSGHAHNNVLDVLGGLGLIGLVAWLAWCGVTLGFLWRLAKRKEAFQIASALFCAWGVFQLNGLTQVNFWEAKVLHQMMWVVALSMVWLGSEVLP